METTKKIIYSDIIITVIAVVAIIVIAVLAMSIKEKTIGVTLMQLVGQGFVIAWQNRAFKVNRLRQEAELKSLLYDITRGKKY